MYVAGSKRLTHEGAKHMMTTAINAAREAGIAVTSAECALGMPPEDTI